ncbi:MAG: M20 family metallopeptidase [Peptoanaerobacter stomatis]|uniref:M20 family metallopeptidase n=1 Tax=Peptoanaerobacter stomatis TaxID=796937 RepID=UPI003FA18138
MSYKEKISKFIDEHIDEYKQIAIKIHDKPEVSNYEFEACKLLSEKLRAEGFDIKVDVAGHRTGFTATYKSEKKGPVIAFLAEYDALVGIGHACGHNLFAANSSLAAAGLKSVIDEVGGEVRVYGTPGEEGGENSSAKCSFVREGFFKDVDIALCAHPADRNAVSSNLLAIIPLTVRFFGKPAHSAASPEQGINALDAVIQVFNGVNALRQHVTPDVRIHGIITSGGDAPNIVPEFAEAKFYLRANTKKQVEELRIKFDNIVKGAGLQTGARGELIQEENSVDDMVMTRTLDEIYAKNVEALGYEIDHFGKKSIGSSDVGNVSYVVPTIQPSFRISLDKIVGHTEGFRQAACSEYGLESIRFCSKALAYTALELILDKNLLEEVKKDYQESLKKVI